MLQHAADKGDAKSMVTLGGILISRSEQPGSDLDQAVALYRKAAARGNTDAHFELGRILLHG